MSSRSSERDRTRRSLIQFEFADEVDMNYVLAFAGDLSVSDEKKTNMARLRRRRGKRFYSDLLFAMTHQFYPEDEAWPLWRAIVKHKKYLSSRLERNVLVHVAALDYLAGIRGEFEKPVLVPEERFARVVRVAITDGLTGLYDKNTFFAQLENEIQRYQRYGNPVSVIMIDIDHFKVFNDSYGHPEGDIRLKDFSALLKSEVRNLDLAARYGGEEFSLLLPQTPQGEALRIAERIRKKTEGRFTGKGNTTASLGVACCPTHATEAKALIRRADKALYGSKRKGRNRVTVA